MDPAVALSVVTFLIGLIAGNRLALGRDRRKEFNEAAQAIRDTLVMQKKRIRPTSPSPTVVEIDRFEQLLPLWKRRGFRAAFEHYLRSRRECEAREPLMGGVVYTDPAPIHASIEHILKYTKLR
jgi:hypothetical protein